jgi:dTDP-L-rhamnose 4-epimerase
MRILVTGGAGFIGSHTCDRLLSLGHEVIVLDALTQPFHRNGQPACLSPEIDFYQGDIRNRDLITNLLRRVNAVYHFAAYQDYLPYFSRFSHVNVVSTALLYEIIVAERLDLAGRGGLVAVGDGRGALLVSGRRRADAGDAAGKRACGGPVGHRVPGVRRPGGVAGHTGAGL